MLKYRLHPSLLIFSSALLLSSAWYLFPAISFVGFVPLFILHAQLENEMVKRVSLRFFLGCYLTFLLWNICTTWWILNSTIVGSVLAYVLNSLLMCIPIMLALFIKKTLGKRWAMLDSWFWLVPYWVSFEYLHLNWDLTWTWLNLGNSFAFAHYLVQWYEYTGILGGTVWILAINILIFNLLKSKVEQSSKYNIPVLIAAVIVPCLISLFLYFNYNDKGKDVEIVVVQPNIDPYNEKFPGTANFIPFDKQLNTLISLSESKVTPNTRFLAWPETSLPVGFDEELVEDQVYIRTIRQFIKKHPGLVLVTGGDTYKIYRTKYDATETARYGEGVGYYDYFNSALKIQENEKMAIYHKSKLVPGVEKLPFPSLFQMFSIDMGGMSGSLGSQKERTVFFNKDSIGIAPIICYESIFGEFVREYIKNGAHFIFIITNDGWWGNTPGHTQHLAYARLRALETRRGIARAANTGISGFINQRGDILIRNTYWIKDAIKYTIKMNKELTLYTLYGDYVGRFSLYISIFSFVVALNMFLILLFTKSQKWT